MLTLSGLTYRIGGRTLLDRGERADRRRQQGRAGRPQRRRQIDPARSDPRPPCSPTPATIELPRGHRIGFLAQEAPGGDGDAARPVLAADDERAALLAEREARRRAAARRRDRGAARRDRGAFGAEPGRAHPRRARPRRGDASAARSAIFGRLADARRACGDPLRRARPVAARRADQPSRPRSRAVARTLSAPLSPHPDPGQPRPPAFSTRSTTTTLHLQHGKLTALFRRLRRLSAGAHRGGAAARRRWPRRQSQERAEAPGLCRPLPRTRRQRRARRRAGSRRWRGWSRSCCRPRRRRRDFAFPEPPRAQPAAGRARPGRGRLCRGQAGIVAARPAARPRRPDRAARRQRQRQDHLRPAPRRPARADGRQVTRLPKLACGFFAQHQIEEMQPEDSAFDHLAALMPQAAARGGARPARRGSASARTRPLCRSRNFRAARRRGSTSRWSPTTRRRC